MKIGVIGAGYWGKKHVDEYSKLGHDVIVSDLSEQSLEFCKSNYGSKGTIDYNDILNDKEIKCVSICTPTPSHYKITMDALNANKNILLEKPIAENLNQSLELIQNANNKKLILLIGHIFRFNNSINKIKDIIQKQILGEVYSVNLRWNNFEPIFSDRDVIHDLGVHPVDIMDNIFEIEPSNISCKSASYRQKNFEVAQITYNLKKIHKKSILVNIELSWLNPIKERKLIIIGSVKTAEIDCVRQKINIIHNDSATVEEIQLEPNNTLKDELDFFLTSSKNKESILPPFPNGEIGKRILDIVETAFKLANK
jgi:UDP-N-acetylglucosamine 3-dehydrogenase